MLHNAGFAIGLLQNSAMQKAGSRAHAHSPIYIAVALAMIFAGIQNASARLRTIITIIAYFVSLIEVLGSTSGCLIFCTDL